RSIRQFGTPTHPSLLRAAAVDGLADDVSVASVPSGLLNHVYRNPPQVPSQLWPCARCIEINRPDDLLRSSDLFSLVCDTRSTVSSSVSRNAFSSCGCISGHSPAKLRPATTTWNQ